MGKTPINIINLADLDSFEDKSFVVAQIAYDIYKWMRKQPGTTRPRLLFFIDEIGGGGGKQDTPLPPRYRAYMKVWFGLGWPAFIAVIAIFFLMVFKPA